MCKHCNIIFCRMIIECTIAEILLVQIVSVMLFRRKVNSSVGTYFKIKKTPFQPFFSASTFIQDEYSKMKYWEYVMENGSGDGCLNSLLLNYKKK